MSVASTGKPSARVIALGQPAAGDDGVGLAVLARLRERGAPPGVELSTAADAASLVPLLDGDTPLVLIDAALGRGTPGTVRTLSPADLDDALATPLSTHGLTVAQALRLAAALAPPLPPIRIVAVLIAQPAATVPPAIGLSPEVAAAVDVAASAVRAALVAAARAPDGE